MQVAPELQILILNAVILGVAYLGIYPGLQEKTANKIALTDLALTALSLLVAGAWFMGTGVRFSLWLIEVNWVVFSLLTLMALELPLFLRFAKKYDIRLFDEPDDRD